MLLFARRGHALSQLAMRASTSLYSTAPATQLAVAQQLYDSRAPASSQARNGGLVYGLALAAAGAAAYGTSTVASADAPAATASETGPKVLNIHRSPRGPANQCRCSMQAPSDPYSRPAELHGLPTKIVLYQYEICPFCYKVKTFLDYHKIPYSTIEVNPLTKAELKWSTSYKKVPIVKLDGDEVVVDSSGIISRLAAEVEALKKPQLPPAAAAKSLTSWLRGGSSRNSGAVEASAEDAAAEERRWRKWVDEWLVKLVTANIYRSWRESWQTMSYISSQANWGVVNREAARSGGAIMMWQIGKRLPKKYHVEGDLREALYAAVGDFLEAVGSKPFLGGDQPNLADLAVFGVIRTVAGTDTFSDVMAKTDIAAWYDRMRKAVGPSARVVLADGDATGAATGSA